MKSGSTRSNSRQNGSSNGSNTRRTQSIEDIRLIPHARLEHLTTSMIDTNAFGTIIVKGHGKKIVLFMGIFMVFFCCIFFMPFALALLNETNSGKPVDKVTIIVFSLLAVIFISLALFNLYRGVKGTFSKTWIAVDEDHLYCQYGMRYNPEKYVTIVRNPEETIVDFESHGRINNTTVYKVIISYNNKPFTAATNLSEMDARQFKAMLEALLKAKLA